MTVADVMTSVAARDVEADGAEQRPQAERQHDAGRRGRRPRRPRRPATDSSSTERSTWRAAGADGPQHRHLPHALGDDDREGVVDDEHADEQGDVGERHQERVEEAEVLLEVGLLVGGVGLAGEDLEARPAPTAALDPAWPARPASTPSRGHDDRCRRRPGSANSSWAVASSVATSDEPGEAVDVAEGGGADEGQRRSGRPWPAR